jgi:hypothetical protein
LAGKIRANGVFLRKSGFGKAEKRLAGNNSNYQDAERNGFKPLIDSEWLPLLEAYMNTKKYDEALDLTYKVTNHDPVNAAGFCQLWKAAWR